MTADIAKLRARWHALLPAPARGGASADVVLDDLVAAYSGPDRHYHDLAHIEALLALAAAEAARFADPVAIDLAILFHDAVYIPSRNDNEAASAGLARARLSPLGVPPERIVLVSRLIEATAHGAGAAPFDADCARLLDLDLSILAAPDADYDAYAAAIRREYRHVPEATYRRGRAKVLRGFLGQPRLYLADDHFAAWEARARANLCREIASLEGP